MRLLPILTLLLLYLPCLAQEQEPWFTRRQQREAILKRSEQEIRDIQSTQKPAKRTGPFTVIAHQYYDTYKERYVPVYSVRIHEKGNYSDRVTLWNSGALTEFQAVKQSALDGRYYQVEVKWRDGTSKTWDYRMRLPRTTIQVYKPY